MLSRGSTVYVRGWCGGDCYAIVRAHAPRLLTVDFAGSRVALSGSRVALSGRVVEGDVAPDGVAPVWEIVRHAPTTRGARPEVSANRKGGRR